MLTAIRWTAFRIQCAWHFYFMSTMTAAESWEYAGRMRYFFDDPHSDRLDARGSVAVEMSYWEE